MDDSLAVVRAGYDRYAEREWERLAEGAQNRLEWLITGYALERHLPPAGGGCHVLDAGGGPGRYAIMLAERGYEVTLLDLSPASLELARERIGESPEPARGRIRGVVEGTITDLSAFPDGCFDAVLCLGGPLSHVIDPAERRRAVRELARVARVGAPLFITGVTRFAVLRGVVQWPGPDDFDALIPSAVGDGVITILGRSVPCYLFWPEELVELLGECGLVVERLYGTTGVGAHLQEENLQALMDDPVRWPIWEQALLRTCDHPNIVGMSRLLLAVARRPA